MQIIQYLRITQLTTQSCLGNTDNSDDHIYSFLNIKIVIYIYTTTVIYTNTQMKNIHPVDVTCCKHCFLLCASIDD